MFDSQNLAIHLRKVKHSTYQGTQIIYMTKNYNLLLLDVAGTIESSERKVWNIHEYQLHSMHIVP